MKEPSHPSLKSASDYNLPELAGFTNKAYQGYIVKIGFNTELLADMLRKDSVKLSYSRVVLYHGKEVGIALVARRGKANRLAAMAVEPESRGLGIGRYLTEQLLKEASIRKDRVFVLEVIEQNTVALQLYQSLGFFTERRLVGYTGQNVHGESYGKLIEVSTNDVAKFVRIHGLPNLPWQISAETLALLKLPDRGYQLGPAYTIISDPAQSQITIKTLLVLPELRRQGWATRLMKMLFVLYPNKRWNFPAVFPEELDSRLFEKLGFTRNPLTQLQMALKL